MTEADRPQKIQAEFPAQGLVRRSLAMKPASTKSFYYTMACNFLGPQQTELGAWFKDILVGLSHGFKTCEMMIIIYFPKVVTRLMVI